VLLAPHTQENHIESTVKKIFETFQTPFQISGHTLTISSSLGISVYPKDGSDYDTLLKNADIALYKSKETGRNSYQFFSKDLVEGVSRNDISLALHNALENNELTLHYQPLIALDMQKVIGVEALIRWFHPEFGTIPPTVLIPIAEKSGLIVSIGKWILMQACMQTKIWHDSISPALKIAVNISKVQFQQPNFVDMIKEILEETGMDPQYLELELTEGILMSNYSEFSEKMILLKEMGINLAIDDFGTGYSNLSYLKYFPFDKIKIDKAFIDEIASEDNDKCIVEAIIHMSKKLGLTVLAEGVEKLEQVKYLTEHHSDQVQGFYFSRPLNAEDCTNFFQEGILPTEYSIPYLGESSPDSQNEMKKPSQE